MGEYQEERHSSLLITWQVCRQMIENGGIYYGKRSKLKMDPWCSSGSDGAVPWCFVNTSGASALPVIGAVPKRP